MDREEWQQMQDLKAECKATQAKLAENWNHAHSDGVIVDVRRDDGSFTRTVTRSAAIMMGDVAMIWLRFICGCYRLDRVAAVPPVLDLEDVEFHHAGGEAACATCKRPLRNHPDDLVHPAYDGRPFLVKLCDGSLVKL
jgi:hypothetical protein